jgi:hypothetical protein
MDGHSDYRTTSIYADYAPDSTRGAMYAAKAYAGGPIEGLVQRSSASDEDPQGTPAPTSLRE